MEFTTKAIYYVTKNKTDGRTWLMDRDIVSVWSDDPYRLEIRVYDNNRREFSRTATYKFDLKEKLDAEFYRESEAETIRPGDEQRGDPVAVRQMKARARAASATVGA